MNKLVKFSSTIFVIIAVIFILFSWAGFSMSRYVDMATDQKILVTLDSGNDFLIAIFFMLMALYFKKGDKKQD